MRSKALLSAVFASLGVMMLVAAIFVTINLIVDMLYAVVDPRIRIDARPA